MFAKKLAITSNNSAHTVATPLRLHTETIHVLQDSDLSRVIGGKIIPPTGPPADGR